MIRKFTNAKVLSKKIDNFFSYCEKNSQKPTVTRLAVALGSNRLGLIRAYNAPVRDDEDRKIIELLEEALARIECWYEDALYNKETVQGAKFSLSTHYGWAERNATTIASESAAPVAVRWMTPEELAAESGRLDAPDQLRAAGSDTDEQDAEEVPRIPAASDDLAALL